MSNEFYAKDTSELQEALKRATRGEKPCCTKDSDLCNRYLSDLSSLQNLMMDVQQQIDAAEQDIEDYTRENYEALGSLASDVAALVGLLRLARQAIGDLARTREPDAEGASILYQTAEAIFGAARELARITVNTQLALPAAIDELESAYSDLNSLHDEYARLVADWIRDCVPLRRSSDLPDR